MMKAEIKVGGLYLAKVSGAITTVRVDAIRESGGNKTTRSVTLYDVTNLRTGRHTTFRSAAKFRGPAKHQQAPEKKLSGLSIGPNEGLTTELVTPVKVAALLANLGEGVEEAMERVEGEQGSDPTKSGEDMTAMTFEIASSPELLTDVGRVLAGIELRGEASPIESMTSLTGDGRTLTAEQTDILRLAQTVFASPGKGRVIVIKAGAGSGKTYECQQLEMALQATIQYTAFNKSLVEDGRGKFKRASVNTTYSLAFKECGRLYAHRLKGNRTRSDEIARMLGIEGFSVTLDTVNGDSSPKTRWLKPGFLAGQCMGAIKRFCQSADRELTSSHFSYIDGIDAITETEDGRKHRGRANNDLVRQQLLGHTCKLWADLSDPDGVIPIPSLMHGVYFKVWQLGRPVIAADVILLDEFQDTAPVLVDVLKQQVARGSMLILVGDDNQRIYEWLGVVNAGDEFPDAECRNLSQSFRFGQVIADLANCVLGTLDESTDLVMQGFDRIPSRVCPVAEPQCYLHRTNAGTVGRVMRGIADGKRPHLVGGGADVVSFCRAAIDLQAKRPTDHPELCCFADWSEVKEYSTTEEGEDLALMVKLIEAFGAEEIRDALEHMPGEEDADFVACTAHKSKGREWRSVRLGQDFPTANKMDDAARRLLYVALTRAQEELDITECPPFCGGQERIQGEDGEGYGEGFNWVPGLKVTYTRPMPTQAELDAYRAAKEAEPKQAKPAAKVAEQVRGYEQPQPKATNGNGGGCPRSSATEFPWTNFDGGWCVRGPADKVGQRVTITRKDGSTSSRTLRKVLKQHGDAWIYSV